MKVVAYCIKSDEKILLAKANGKKHDITLISNALNLDTVNYAAGKDAVIVCNNDAVPELLINACASFGIKYIVTKSFVNNGLAENALHSHGIRIRSIFSNSKVLLTKEVTDNLASVYNATIQLLDHWQTNADEVNLCD